MRQLLSWDPRWNRGILGGAATLIEVGHILRRRRSTVAGLGMASTALGIVGGAMAWRGRSVIMMLISAGAVIFVSAAYYIAQSCLLLGILHS